MSSPMKWTREAPKVPGAYWRKTRRTDPSVVRVLRIGGHLCFNYSGQQHGARVGRLRDEFWAGPIPEPEGGDE